MTNEPPLKRDGEPIVGGRAAGGGQVRTQRPPSHPSPTSLQQSQSPAVPVAHNALPTQPAQVQANMALLQQFQAQQQLLQAQQQRQTQQQPQAQAQAQLLAAFLAQQQKAQVPAPAVARPVAAAHTPALASAGGGGQDDDYALAAAALAAAMGDDGASKPPTPAPSRPTMPPALPMAMQAPRPAAPPAQAVPNNALNSALAAAMAAARPGGLAAMTGGNLQLNAMASQNPRVAAAVMAIQRSMPNLPKESLPMVLTMAMNMAKQTSAMPQARGVPAGNAVQQQQLLLMQRMLQAKLAAGATGGAGAATSLMQTAVKPSSPVGTGGMSARNIHNTQMRSEMGKRDGIRALFLKQHLHKLRPFVSPQVCADPGSM